MLTLDSHVPEELRSPNLKSLALGWSRRIAGLFKISDALKSATNSYFFFIAYSFVVDEKAANVSPAMSEALAKRREFVASLGIDGEQLKTQLQAILKEDKHLRECCPTEVELAYFLDSHFITPVSVVIAGGADDQQIEFSFQEFQSLTYGQGRFRRLAATHLFNFDMEGDTLAIEGNDDTLGNITIERIEPNRIPLLLGETGYSAFLHPANTGNCFVIEAEYASAVSDFNWLLSKRQKALSFAQVLQYFQDGVVHATYTVPLFQPSWAHELRRSGGLFFLGNTRQDPYDGGNKYYKLASADDPRLARWWRGATSSKILAKLDDRKNNLRQAIYRAGEYYEAAHERSGPVDRLIALAIALESMFSPTDSGELRFRISLTAAQFIGRTPNERKLIFDRLYELYGRRSKVVHGAYDVDKYVSGELVLNREIDEWSKYIRRALIGFLALYFSGMTNRNEILRAMAEANFETSHGDAFRARTDLESVFVD
jgi:hypothetical protein